MSTLILCFHRIADPLFGGRSKLAISEQDFERVLDEVGRRYEFVPLSDMKKESRSRRAVVTFDDGYADNYYTALPILESRGISSTFFLSTGFIDKQLLFPPDALDALFNDTEGRPGLISLNSSFLFGKEDYWSALDAFASSDDSFFWSALSEISEKYWDVVLANDPMRRPMTESEVSELARHPLATIGPHTLSHRRLSTLALDIARAEIRDSLERSRALGGHVVPYFAYPFGQIADMDPKISDEARILGLSSLTTLPALVNSISQRRLSAFGLPRLSIGPSEISLVSFLCRFLPYASAFPRTWFLLLKIRRALKA